MLSLHLKIIRWFELLLLYIGLPLLLNYSQNPGLKFVALLLVFGVFLYVLLRDKTFKKRQFRLNGFRAWRMILWRTSLMIIFLLTFTWFFYPAQYFALPAHATGLWAMTVLAYPFVSVIPQELVFRVYFYHRFQGLVANRNLLMLVNALLFSYSHIVFNNWVVLVFTFIASLLFSFTYLRHRSFTIVVLEHSLYGLLVFTIGPASFFHSF